MILMEEPSPCTSLGKFPQIAVDLCLATTYLITTAFVLLLLG